MRQLLAAAVRLRGLGRLPLGGALRWLQCLHDVGLVLGSVLVLEAEDVTDDLVFVAA